MDEKEELTTTAVQIRTATGGFTVNRILEANVQAFRSGRNCPVMGLFRAGAIQREEITQREESEGVSEIYVPELAYDKSIYEGSPDGVLPKIDAYGLVTVKPKDTSDECSVKWGSEDEPNYDRRVPCKAHDYCWDLVRFAVAPGLSEDDCDDRFKDLMYSDCADRDTRMEWCRNDAENWEGWMGFGNNLNIFSNLETQIAPGVVVVQNVETDMCLDIEGSLKQSGARLIQWQCKEHNGHIPNNRLFRFHPGKSYRDWYFRIQPEHDSNSCASVTSTDKIVLSKPNRPAMPLGPGPCQATHNLFVLVSAGEDNEERYTIRSSYSSNSCWTPETSDQGSGLINATRCNRSSNNLHLWRIREVEE